MVIVAAAHDQDRHHAETTLHTIVVYNEKRHENRANAKEHGTTCTLQAYRRP